MHGTRVFLSSSEHLSMRESLRFVKIESAYLSCWDASSRSTNPLTKTIEFWGPGLQNSQGFPLKCRTLLNEELASYLFCSRASRRKKTKAVYRIAPAMVENRLIDGVNRSLYMDHDRVVDHYRSLLRSERGREKERKKDTYY